MNFKQWLYNEMPIISMQGKSVFADNQPLKELDVNSLKNNIVFFRIPKEQAGFFAEGTFWIYFMDSEESAKEMKEGKVKMLQVPMYGITDVWKKKHSEKGTESILGLLQGTATEKLIYIDKMTVRPKYKKNTINTKMIDFIKSKFPTAKVKFSTATEEGKEFINKYTNKPNIT